MRFLRRLWQALRERGILAGRRTWRSSEPALRASTSVRAGDIALEAGRTREALTLYGRGIDSYLEADLHRKAEEVCRRIIEIDPGVIRTRYTLAVLAIGRNDVREAERRIRAYMQTVTGSRAEEMAVPSLLEMAAATVDPAIWRMLTDALREAGRPDLAERVRADDPAPRSESWTRAVHSAMKSPLDLAVRPHG